MLIGGFILAGLLLIIILASSLSGGGDQSSRASVELVPPDPEQQPKPSWSKLRSFKHGAVCADGEPCALIGKYA